MKLQTILEQDVEVLTRDTPNAEKFAKEFIKIVTDRFGKDSDTYSPEVHAKKMANNFYNQILREIDRELEYQRMKKIRKTKGGFSAKA